ncbi:MAG: hypothetical protein QM613_00090 [Micrococcaceae bacterium]
MADNNANKIIDGLITAGNKAAEYLKDEENRAKAMTYLKDPKNQRQLKQVGKTVSKLAKNFLK